MLITNFAALIVGSLGKSGELSLKSILELNPKRFCYLADEIGEKWIDNAITKYKLNRKMLCKHQVNKKIYDELKIDNSLKKHRVFGQESFVRLTPLKWVLISQVLKKHKEEKYVVFSDLDVIWFKLPNFKKIIPNTIRVQNDFRPKSKKHYYCTGIMFWPQSIKSIDEAKKLYAFQTQLISSGNLTPDETAFNLYINQTSFKCKVIALNKNEYVIGHKTRKILGGNSSFIHKTVAYHANYFIGDKQKYIAMKSILSKKAKTIYWPFGLISIYKIKIRNRLIMNLKKY